MGLFRRSQCLGALLLPRHVADAASASWPKCARCLRNVDAYGIENETRKQLEIWARCDGVRKDPMTGRAVDGAPRVHEPRKGGVIIHKGPQWSEQSMTDVLRRLAFFPPDGEDASRDLVQVANNPEGVTLS